MCGPIAHLLPSARRSEQTSAVKSLVVRTADVLRSVPLAAAVERGFSTAVFSDTREGKKAAEEFAKLARFDVIVRKVQVVVPESAVWQRMGDLQVSVLLLTMSDTKFASPIVDGATRLALACAASFAQADGSLVTGDGFAAGLVFKCTRGAVPPHLDSARLQPVHIVLPAFALLYLGPVASGDFLNVC